MSRILIVEDHADVRRLICVALKSSQHDILEAEDGQAGLDAFQSFGPDLVILDIRMPGDFDGFEVCRRIRCDPINGRLPILMLSADAFDSDRKSGEVAGATAFVAKPFGLKELRSVVAQLLVNRESVLNGRC